MKAQILATTAAAALLGACSTIPAGDIETMADADVAVAVPEGTPTGAIVSVTPTQIENGLLQ